MNVVRLLHPHRRALWVVLGLCLLLGAKAVVESSRSIYPRVAFPRISVIAERGEAPVRGMLIAVTKPIEQAVAAVPDLLRVRSKTVRGAGELSLDFSPNADMREAITLVRARIAAAGLPSDVALVVEQQTPAVFPVLSFNVLPRKGSAPVERARVAEWATLDLKPRLARLADTFMVTVQSGDVREYEFLADETAMRRFGVTLEDVRDALAAANIEAAVGRSAAEGLQYQILVDGLLRSADAIGEVAIPREGGEVVTLSMVGKVSEETAERTMVVTGGGDDGIVVSVFLRDGGKVTELSRDVRTILEEARGETPQGATIVEVYDQAHLVEDSIRGVRDAIALGAGLAVVLLFAFLGDWRITLVAGTSIPLSVVLTLALFPRLGESLNLMSLGGLAVAIGLIIDDAIVVVENAARRLAGVAAHASSRERFDAIADATSEVFGAIVGSSLTTVVVFLPLVLLEGVVGQFFRSLATSLGVSILASLVVALVYVPMMMLLPGLAPRAGRPVRRAVAALGDAYARLLGPILDHPAVTAVVLTAILAGGTLVLPHTATGFLPEMDEGGFVLDYALPVGSSLDETDAVCRRIEAILSETPEVGSFSRRTGAELGFFATEQFTGDMLVGLVPPASRSKSVFAVISELRQRIAKEVPQAETEFIQVMQDTIADLAGNPSPIEVKIFGTDYRAIQRVADAVSMAMEKVPGIVDVTSGVSFGSPELIWRVDSRRAARFGLTTETIAADVSRKKLGDVATRIEEGDLFIDVRVRSADELRRAPSTAPPGPTIFVDAREPRGKSVPLASVADFVRDVNENELERENQTPMVRVTAAVEGRDLGSAAADVEHMLGTIPRGASIRIEMGGQAESQKSAFKNMIAVFALGVGLVFLLLVIQFRSLTSPLVIFFALPFGQIGALWALDLSGTALNISSGMGLIMLIGLVVKNGIIMIEHAQDLARRGFESRTAAIEAARVRLRPVLMTTIAAVAGLLPLALSVGAGAALQRPLAIAVIGGLLTSTIFTLIVVPLGCSLLGARRLGGEERP